MDFDEAARAHSSWKRRLVAYSVKRDGSLNIAEVQADDRCELGRWIHGEGLARHSMLPEFATLKEQHTRFHRAAAVVLQHIEAGTFESEEIALGASSPFSEASSACVSALMAMKRRTIR